jgi:hypothetical protein
MLYQKNVKKNLQYTKKSRKLIINIKNFIKLNEYLFKKD